VRPFLPLLLTWLCAASALAQSDAGTPPLEVQPGEPVIEGEEQELQFREPGPDLRWHAPPPVGACLGGTCTVAPGPRTPVPRPEASPRLDPRMRFAYAGATLGVLSAGLVLGSAIAIAMVDDPDSERITRGVWLGYLTLSTGVVALSAHLAHRSLGASSEARKATRSIGWTAFALAFADGAILWAGAFHGRTHVDALTIGAGAIGACALLPHALDAYVAGRGLRIRQMASVEPLGTGLRVRF
jgi:hypothetical protein